MSPMPVKTNRSTRSLKARAVTMEKRRWRVPKADRSVIVGWAIAVGVTLAIFFGWHFSTRRVRNELRRVEAYLESQPQYQDIALAVPWFRVSMPGKVALTGVATPGGYSYEVKVELKGEYETATRTAHLKGIKQVLSPYTKVIVDDHVPVPAE